MLKKTKIVATVGPSTIEKETLIKMIQEGVNVFRINFSHGNYDDHTNAIKKIKEADALLGTHTAILADLQGPKIRIGEMSEDGLLLSKGDEFILTISEKKRTKLSALITYKGLPNDVEPGELILLDDGKIVLETISTDKKSTIITKVIAGGKLYSRKGVNLPNTVISTSSLTEKDKADLEVALDNRVDWIGFSFVRNAREIIELRHLITQLGGNAKIIAKIEKPEAIENLESIIEESDAIMVARGDLGVEVPLEKVPLLQKKIVTHSRQLAKPVIIATQMMESMMSNITPNRAEVNDVANAVMDGADAVMLSGETSVGKHPIEVIKIMTRIIKEVEESFEPLYIHESIPKKNHERFITDSICFNVCRLAKRVEAKGIVTMTHSGYTAFKISSQRPKSSIFVFSSNKKLLETLSLVWGVSTYFYDKTVSTDHTIADIKYLLKESGLVESGDLLINTASIPLKESGKTNMLKLSYID